MSSTLTLKRHRGVISWELGLAFIEVYVGRAKHASEWAWRQVRGSFRTPWVMYKGHRCGLFTERVRGEDGGTSERLCIRIPRGPL